MKTSKDEYAPVYDLNQWRRLREAQETEPFYDDDTLTELGRIATVVSLFEDD